MIRAVTLFVLAITGAFSADADETDISGAWSFSAKIRSDCSFNGEAHLTPNLDTAQSDYACELTAHQVCTDGFEAVVRQSCTVRNTRGQIWLKATIEEFLVGQQDGNYKPDNFSLSVHSEDEMIGVLTNSNGARPAVWTKKKEGSIS